MKIRRIKLLDVVNRPLLKGLELNFSDDNDLNRIDPNCLIGVNGSGKSQLLETIADLFYYLDGKYRKVNKINNLNVPCLFELDYKLYLNNQNYDVNIILSDYKGKSPEFNITDEDGNEVKIEKADFENYLPFRVVGYTSGDNETLSIPFMDYYDDYAEHNVKRAIRKRKATSKAFLDEDYDPRLYLMDYNTNKGVVISNLALDKSNHLEVLLRLIDVHSLRNFQMIFQTKHKAAKGKDGIEPTPEQKAWVNQLSRIATAHEYYPSENKWILDFYLNEATKKAFEHYFKTSDNLYTALYKIELLNNLIVDKNIRENIKKVRKLKKQLIKAPTVPDQDKVLHYSEIKIRLNNGDVIDYIKLSDGEHQFLNVFGTILMQNQDNILFLLDEPETHFNPKWRREFIKLWNDITVGRRQDNFITTHSPFVVSDCKQDKVYMFRKEDGKLNVSRPSKETYGASYDFILKMAFNLENTLSEMSSHDINDLLKSESIEEISKRMTDFGESPEKFYLIQKLQELRLRK